MPKIPEVYNLGNRENIDPERLLEILDDMYRTLAIAINAKPDVYFRKEADGTPKDANIADTFVSNGDININTNTGKVEIATDHPTLSTVTWMPL